MIAANSNHPAKFSASVLQHMLDFLNDVDDKPGKVVVDPFAGPGESLDDVARGGFEVHGIELEPEWAAVSPRVQQGDATALPFAGAAVHVIFTSPSYGNRLADVYRTDKTADTVLTYAQKLGRPLTVGSGASLPYGEKYRRLHTDCIAEWWRVLVPGGKVILNMSDHIRDHQVVRVTAWWIKAMLAAGFELRAAETIRTPRFGKGRNGQARVAGEQVIVFAKPNQADPTAEL